MSTPDQNQKLIQALEELERSRSEVKQLNSELEVTNRGVVALYAELDEKAEYLRRASDLKTRFLSNMTHELRTPVNSVLSLCRILLDKLDGDLSNEQEKQVQFIQKAATDLSELVNDLLDLAKVEAGKTMVHPEEFEVKELFTGLQGTLGPLLGQISEVKLVFEEPENIPTLHTDGLKVSQILRNLISNALKFTERGEVRVRATATQRDEVTFSVSDTGVGIPLEYHERIFEEFVQLEGVRQQKVKGTGLGLPITKRLTELLGGKISVESGAGAGTTISVTIPTVFQSEDLPGISRTVDPLRFQVLVVDESDERLLLYDRLFQETALQCIPARTIREARNALMESRPMAIILKVHKQNERHWGFLYELKMNPATEHTYLGVTSDESSRERAFALGANGFFEEPLAGDRVVRSLGEVTAALPRPFLLLVDDDESARYVLRELFSGSRFQIVEAESGAEGLRKAAEIKPAAIFLDLTMPKMDGIEVTKRLKADLVTRNIPIIIRTAGSLSEEEESFLHANTAAILSKNVTSREEALEGIRAALLAAGVAKQQK